MYKTYGKRLADLALAVPALVLLAPAVVLLGLCVRVNMGSPVFFRQTRAGLGGRSFTLLKFRTMTDARSPDGDQLPDEQRLTAFGKWLRRTSLDELPELLNVVRGDMSLVGPRPLLVQYLARYAPWQARRHEVRPGITGWAQINGRNAVGWVERFWMDVWYVDHLTLPLDLWILLRTLWLAAKAEGIAAQGHATMPEFGIEASADPKRGGAG